MPKHEKKATKPSRKIFIKGFIVLGIFIVIAYIVILHQQLLQLQQKMQIQMQMLVTQQHNHWSSLHENLTQKIQNLQKDIKIQQQDHLIKKLCLYKVRFLLELAETNAYWTLDTSSTLALLKQADLLLAPQTDPALLPIRASLANEIHQQETLLFDQAGLLSQLDTLKQSLTEKKTNETFTTPTPAPQKTSSWQTLLQQLVIIRHHQKPIEPLQNPAYQATQQLIWQLNIQEAQWAVIHQNEALYQRALQALKEQLSKTTDPSHQTIESLQQVSLHPPHQVPQRTLSLLNTLLDTPSQSEI